MGIRKALMLGDVSGISGVRALVFDLSKLVKKHEPAIVIANGENSDGGYGISEKAAFDMFGAGVNVITTGNHAFEAKDSLKLYADDGFILRPENFLQGVPGRGSCVFAAGSLKIGVLNLHVPSGTGPVENLYVTAEKAISRLRRETNVIFVDLHGEYSHQKEAFAMNFDGRVTAVCGTHTHVQTMDEKVLDGGTAYITDLGMCGATDSVIGGNVAESIRKIVTGISIRVPVLETEGALKGAVIGFDDATGKAVSIERI